MKRLFSMMLVAGLLLAFSTTDARRTESPPVKIIPDKQEVILMTMNNLTLDGQWMTLKDNNCGGTCGGWYAVWNGVERQCGCGCPLACQIIFQWKPNSNYPDPACPCGGGPS